jgi:hypothetical protein
MTSMKIKKIIQALGMLSGAVSIGSSVMSMTLNESDAEWMYSSTQVSNATSRIALALSVLAALHQYLYESPGPFDRIKGARLFCSVGAITFLGASAYEASTALARPELPPMLNAIALFLSCFKFEDSAENRTPTRMLSDVALSLFALGGLTTGLEAVNASDFYHELLHTNLSLMFVALGYFANACPEMLEAKKTAFSVGLPMLFCATLQMVIAGMLEKIPMQVLLGFSSALFGLGAGCLHLSFFEEPKTQRRESTVAGTLEGTLEEGLLPRTDLSQASGSRSPGFPFRQVHGLLTTEEIAKRKAQLIESSGRPPLHPGTIPSQ